MENQVPYTPDTSQLEIIQKKLYLDSKIRSGIGWFYWIAGLSLVNTLTWLFGLAFTFVIGLGATQIVDVVMSSLAEDLGEGWSILRFIGLAINICIAGVFVLFGYLGRKQYRWPIIIGMVLYAIDGVILLLFKDIFGAAFHVWALFGIWGGLKSIKELKVLEESGISESIESIRQRLPSLQRPQATPQQKRLRLILVGILVFVLLAFFVIFSLQ